MESSEASLTLNSKAAASLQQPRGCPEDARSSSRSNMYSGSSTSNSSRSNSSGRSSSSSSSDS
eukprot:2143767-Pyramimonas_sp.AAC.1